MLVGQFYERLGKKRPPAQRSLEPSALTRGQHWDKRFGNVGLEILLLDGENLFNLLLSIGDGIPGLQRRRPLFAALAIFFSIFRNTANLNARRQGAELILNCLG